MDLRVGCAVFSLLLAAPAFAGPSEVAQQAQEAHERHCKDVSGSRVDLAAEALAQVSQHWAEVDRVYRDGGTLYLLYWRGVLAQCLGQEDRALPDLQRFASAATDVSRLAGMREDAVRRVRRLEQKETSGPAPAGIAAIGGGLAAGAAVAGISGAVSLSDAFATGETIVAEAHSSSELGLLVDEGDRQANTGMALLAVAGVLAAASGVSFGLAANAGSRSRAAVLVAPTRGGLALVIGGTW